MKKSWLDPLLIWALSLGALSGCCVLLKAQTPHREVAVTIDDLPLAQGDGDLATVQKVNRKLLAALAAHHIPAVGFVNESNLFVRGETDARIEVLRMWLDAGMILGNHTFSHLDLNKSSLSDYEDDTIRGEAVTRPLMRERGINKIYFRYPYNHTGTTKEARDAFQAFLRSRGYEIAPFTIDHEDYIFAGAYRKARQKNDKALARRIREAYLDHLDTMFGYFERRSQQVLGYEIRQIFLIHVSPLNADSMDAMAGKLEQRGYSFITLDAALQDKAYRLRDEYAGPYGISWLHRWLIGLGKKLDYRDEPDAPQFVRDIYEAK